MNSPHRWAAVIAIAYLALALAYGFANPPFEATDEIRHFRYVRYLVLNHALPPVSADASKELQAHHPPLYYTLAALITAPVSSDAGTDYSLPVNIFWGFRYYEPSTDNKNQYVHSPDDRWPFTSGATLIVYLARWVSTLFGLGAVFMAYRLGQTLFPDRLTIALGAMAFVAFNPTVLHSASSVNNDAAAAFFGSWAVVEAAAIAQSGSTRAMAIRLGIALGLGVMSKVSVAVLGVVAVAAYAVSVFRRPVYTCGAGTGERSGAAFSRAAKSNDAPVAQRSAPFDFASLREALLRALSKFLLMAVTAALIAGWWFIRNYSQVGDPMGLSDYQSAWVGEADRARLFREAISGLPYAWTTVWARFDYGQIILPDWTYQAWGVLCALPGIGLVRVRTQLRSPGALMTVLAIAVSLAAWGVLMVNIPATAHARHILHAYPAIGLLLALGWHGLIPRRREGAKAQNSIPLGAGVLGFSFSLFALFGYLAPAFAYPRTVAALPADVTPASANFEGAAEIVGYRFSSDSVQPGDRVDVTVYWKPLARTAIPLQVFVHLVDSQGIIAAQRDTYPGLGNAATTTWHTGQVFADMYRVFIPDTAYAPETLAVRIGLWNTAESRPLIADDSDALAPGKIGLQPRRGDAPNPVVINFENRMTLVGYVLDKRVAAPGGTLVLTTYWRAVRPDSDYWAYAHVAGADGRIWALADSIIIPPITQWPTGEIRSETRQIVLAPDAPPGQYTLEFGLTRILSPGQQRLSVLAEDGHEIGDHIDLVRIRVEP